MSIQSEDGWIKTRVLTGLTPQERIEAMEYVWRKQLQYEERGADLVIGVPAHLIEGFDLGWSQNIERDAYGR